MEKYDIEITEYLSRVVSVEAKNKKDAVSIVKNQYKNSQIVLKETDYIDADIDVYNPDKFISRLDSLLLRIDNFSKARDWDQFHSPSNLSKSISIEAGELLECFQWDNDKYNMDDVKEELADVLNYCFQMCNVLNIDPIDIVNKKIDISEKKYPVDKAKGKSTKYNKL